MSHKKLLKKIKTKVRLSKPYNVDFGSPGRINYVSPRQIRILGWDIVEDKEVELMIIILKLIQTWFGENGKPRWNGKDLLIFADKANEFIRAMQVDDGGSMDVLCKSWDQQRKEHCCW